VINFLAGFAVGVLCVLGVAGLFAALVCAAWRDSILRHLNGGGA
jgi:hypothetical protein